MNAPLTQQEGSDPMPTPTRADAAVAAETKLPDFKIVAPPTPKSARKLPNPYDDLLHAMAGEAEQSAQGFSQGRSFDFSTNELAKLHEQMIRRAARNHEPALGVSVIRSPAPNRKAGTDVTNLVFAVIPKRVVNRKTGQVESPAGGAESLAAAS